MKFQLTETKTIINKYTFAISRFYTDTYYSSRQIKIFRRHKFFIFSSSQLMHLKDALKSISSSSLNLSVYCKNRNTKNE